MNERLIRSGLDQALLAVAALERGNVETAQVHATLAGALSQPPEVPDLGTFGPRAGSRSRDHLAPDVVEQWFDEIETLNLPSEPEVKAPPLVDEPVEIIDEPPGRARARARREARDA